MTHRFLVFTCLFFTSYLIQAQNSPPAPEADSEEVFVIVDERPRFPGCEEYAKKSEKDDCAQKKMLEYIYSSLEYPIKAKEKGIQGQVVVQFVVGKDGSIEDIKITHGVYPEIDEAALKVVKEMNNLEEKWIPGRYREKVVKVKYILPIRFKLDDNVSSLYVDEQAILEGCQGSAKESHSCTVEKLKDYILSNLENPETAIKEEKILVDFTILNNGKIVNIRVRPTETKTLAVEIKKVLKEMNNNDIKWIPGQNEGIDVSIDYKMFPIEFN